MQIEYEKSEMLHQLFSAESKTLFDLLQKQVNENYQVLLQIKKFMEATVFHENDIGRIYEKFDAYSDNLSFLIKLVRNVSKQLRENNLKSIMLSGDSASNSSSKELYSADVESNEGIQHKCISISYKPKPDTSNDGAKPIPNTYSTESIEEIQNETISTVFKSVFTIDEPYTTEELFPKFVRKLRLHEFSNGYHFKAWILGIENFRNCTFYVSEKKTEDIILASDAAKLENLTSALPADQIFGIKCLGDEVILRGALPRSVGCDDKVLLIDIGELASINENVKLYKLPDIYQIMPAQSIYCKLIGSKCSKAMEHSKTCLPQLLSEYQNTLVHFEVVSMEKGGMLEVLIVQNTAQTAAPESGKELTRTCDSKASSTSTTTNAILSGKENCEKTSHNPFMMSSLPYADPLNGKMNKEKLITITATCVLSGNCFYGNIAGENNSKRDLIWSDDEVQLTQRIMETAPQCGHLVLAQYLLDKHWYRAKILKVDKRARKFKVFYVDFGNEECVPLSCLAKCELTEEMQPFLAERFRIIDIAALPKQSDKYDESIKVLNDLIADKPLNVRVVGFEDKDLLIEFTGMESTIPQSLFGAGLVVMNE